MAENSSRGCLDVSRVTAALGEYAGDFDVHAVAECDSTNGQLLAMAERGASSGYVLIADSQTAGRGRRGRTWYSTASDSLTFSLLWRFAPESSAPKALSLAIGLALARAMESLGIDGVQLKWPNDVLHQGRKLAGILVELQPGETRSAVIGIGINLRVPPIVPEDIARHAVGVYALGSDACREEMLALVLSSLAGCLKSYAAGGFSALRQEWVFRHAFQNRAVCVSGDTSTLSGVCRGVDDDGALLLDTGTRLEKIVAGDVSLRPAVTTAS